MNEEDNEWDLHLRNYNDYADERPNMDADNPPVDSAPPTPRSSNWYDWDETGTYEENAAASSSSNWYERPQRRQGNIWQETMGWHLSKETWRSNLYNRRQR